MNLTGTTKPDRYFLIATHGSFSAGVKSSLDMIIGAMGNVFIIQAYTDGNKSIEDEINTVLSQLNDTGELIVFCDIMGGSVTNQVIQQAMRPNVHIVAGFNLPLLIEVLLADTDTPIEEVIADAINNAKEQIVHINKLLTNSNPNQHD